VFPSCWLVDAYDPQYSPVRSGDRVGVVGSRSVVTATFPGVTPGCGDCRLPASARRLGTEHVDRNYIPGPFTQTAIDDTSGLEPTERGTSAVDCKEHL